MRRSYRAGRKSYDIGLLGFQVLIRLTPARTPNGETRGDGFVMRNTTYTHTYPNAEQALAAALAVADTRELRQAR
jgi:hypothetical protein